MVGPITRAVFVDVIPAVKKERLIQHLAIVSCRRGGIASIFIAVSGAWVSTHIQPVFVDTPGKQGNLKFGR
jgi:hypothetical protein